MNENQISKVIFYHADELIKLMEEYRPEKNKNK